MRIAIGGVHTESSTFNPVPTRIDDFRVLRGAELTESPDYAAWRELEPAEVLPLLHARALPGGPVAADAERALREEFLERLTACGPVDGVWLILHGAMSADGLDDAEGDWIEAVRDVVGSHAVLVASYDLHGNVSRRVARYLDGLSAYRTAPHIDVHDTHLRAVRMLRRALTTGVRPTLARVPVPVLLPGERTSTRDRPADGIYASLAELDARDGVWDASMLVGYAWADEPRATASAVVTGDDPEAVRATARDLGRRYWNARRAFSFGVRTGTLEACVRFALREAPSTSDDAVAIVADSGDNPTAGGVGDRADGLTALLDAGARDALVAGIAAPDATDASFAAGEGARLTFTIGSQLAAGSGPVVRHEAEVVRTVAAERERDREAVVRIGGTTVILGGRRRPYHTLADFGRAGLDPRRFRLLMVKSGYLAPELQPWASPSLLALSPGAVAQDVAGIGHARVPRPFFPADDAFDWSPRVDGSVEEARS